MADITLQEWMRQEQEMLANFERYWRDEMAALPDEFPAELPAGDWDEQFQAWSEMDRSARGSND